jgi:hypothetical protein
LRFVEDKGLDVYGRMRLINHIRKTVSPHVEARGRAEIAVIIFESRSVPFREGGPVQGRRTVDPCSGG